MVFILAAGKFTTQSQEAINMTLYIPLQKKFVSRQQMVTGILKIE